MTWNQDKRVYVDDQGNDIPASQMRDYVDQYIASNQDDVDTKSAELLAGTITVAAFFEWMRETIISMHGVASILAYGGEAEMTATEWQRVAEKVTEELAYLENFEAKVEQAQASSEAIAADAASLIARNVDVPAGLESVVEGRVLSALMNGESVEDAISAALADSISTEAADAVAASIVGDITDTRMEDLIWGNVDNRARLYMDSVFGSYENSVRDREGDAGAVGVRRVTEGDDHVCDGCEGAASDEYVPMSEIADIGDFECGGRDRCSFEFEYLNVEPLTIDREIYAGA